jgi:hypothetical protein
VHWKRLPTKENYRLIPYISSGTAIILRDMGSWFGPSQQRSTIHDQRALYRMCSKVFAPLHRVGLTSHIRHSTRRSQERVMLTFSEIRKDARIQVVFRDIRLLVVGR